MTRRKIFGVVLDIALIALIVYMILFFFDMTNEFAREDKDYEIWPPGSIPEHVYERLLNGDGYWE
tara:strand:+ start:140 stop:334 length:195 start_codon:yes stop_codon:yes gene_type:complete